MKHLIGALTAAVLAALLSWSARSGDNTSVRSPGESRRLRLYRLCASGANLTAQLSMRLPCRGATAPCGYSSTG